MRTIVAMCVAFSLLGCGHGTGEGESPKSRRNDVGPIERELRRTDEGSSEEPAPTAERERDVERVRPVAAARPTPRPASARERPSGASEAAPAAAPEALEVADAETAGTDEPAAVAAVDEAEPAPSLELTRVVVARAVEGREPVGLPPLSVDLERAFLFVEARNDGPADATLAVEWIGPDGTHGAPIELSVPVAARWRTWATTSRVHGAAGSWTVVVRVGERELARRSFEVRAGGDTLASATPATASVDG